MRSSTTSAGAGAPSRKPCASGQPSRARNARWASVSTLKIDRSFLRDVPQRADAAAVVTAILQLAGALGRTAVAEGVETEAQRAFLAREGCPLAQGFLLAAPAPPEVVEGLMAAPVLS